MEANTLNPDPLDITEKCSNLVGVELEQIRLAFYRFVEQEGWDICGSGAGLNEDGSRVVDVSFYLNGRHYWVDIRLALGQEAVQ
jgi:hypothetical protein